MPILMINIAIIMLDILLHTCISRSSLLTRRYVSCGCSLIFGSILWGG
nr:MAG TPA: hypothetical protein [Caudoviricetes sp.]